MEELIFFAVIIFFSILESIARSRKAKSGGEAEGSLPEQGEWETRLPDRDPSPTTSRGGGVGAYDDDATYDDDPSYDDLALGRTGRRDRTLERYKTPHGTDAPASAPDAPRPSSETMLPGDLLEQLEALAGRRRAHREEARTIELPKQSPPLPPPIERTEVGTGHGYTDPLGSGRSVGSRAPVGSTAPIGTRSPIGGEHFVHSSHAEYGTDPSSRSASEQDGLDPLAEYLDEDGAAVRRQLFGGRAALRSAFVLKEVLGPPKALREDDRVF